MKLFNWIAAGVRKYLSSHRGSEPSSRLRVSNLTRHTVLATSLEVAESSAQRNKGLLGREALNPGEGLWIRPCESVHTFWMRFPIDLVYLDRDLHIRKLVRDVRPWRLSGCLSAHSILELPSGTIRGTLTEIGDLLEFSVAPSPEKLTMGAGRKAAGILR